MDLPTIKDEEVIMVITKEWQPIASLISKLKIKDMLASRSLQYTLKNLKLQKKVSTRIINGKKHWKLYDKALNKTHDKIINLSQSEKINEEIKLLKEKLDFLDKLENMIQSGITGYELAYELKEYSNTMRKKIREIREMNKFDSEIITEVEKVYLDLDILKKVGNNKVLDYEEIREHRLKKFTRNIGKEIIEEIKEERLKIINEIGYLEFLKKKPTTKGSTEKINYEKDLDDLIGFLDEKYKEWEKIKSGKKD